ncbi:hypothetical protein [Mesoplasma lactucae]|uniref:Uncharacterized protein n=1 Tax=Mesoplasma lactucae ATCC 49193 TaxID=81460 RepID=A0A291IST7_9MOLU|nr:hypothetical protein [Mesoplasma lactucae]ATG97804.1 hypothetical protein CP520_03650 [Mesoplasma lactucae ATCC 49193]ATZ20418.1 hypothetical protein MLACT_v1c05970 [Mesoplasma lactucae ATCC 49193]MCL8216589.1 hypothetical protein [Mesoplasma lactucae ATCC 49193]
MSKIDGEMIVEIINSYERVNNLYQEGKDGSRSASKMDELHAKIASDLNDKINASPELKGKYRTDSKKNNKNEIKAEGAIYSKKLDIAILDVRTKQQDIVGAIEVKAPTASFAQNKVNYFEQGMGECVNLKLSKKKYYDVYIYLDKIPNFKGSPKMLKSVEDLDQSTFDWLRKRNNIGVMSKEDLPYVPNSTLIMLLKSPNLPNDITKEGYYSFLTENLSPKKKNPNSLYADDAFDNLFKTRNLFFNDYEEFLNEIIEDLKENERR